MGGFRIVYQYASGLAARGHKVSVVHAASLRQQGRRRDPVSGLRRWARLRLLRPTVSWQQMDPNVRLLYRPNLSARHIPRGDVVIATAWQTAEEVAGYPESRGLAFYLIQHHETWSGEVSRVDATWQLPLHKIVIARWLLDLAYSKGLTDVVHIPNAIDTNMFQIHQPIDERPAKVAMMYSDLPWKGSPVGLGALQIAKEALPDLRAVVFSAKPPSERLPHWVEAKVNPSQEQLVHQIYNDSAIYLCPSFGEGWHLPPAEAMACGCAVVSSDIGGVGDYAVHEDTALLAPPGDATTLAASLIELLTDESLRIKLAKAGYQKITSDFSWNRSISSLETHLRLKVDGQ